tara:strand:+ start:810 stop:2027 length:1218 start_codon:yes stop_codon:yes gene_type:complete
MNTLPKNNTYKKRSSKRRKKQTSRRKSKKRSRKKKYKVKSKKCKKYSKHKEPKCDNQDKCLWIVGKGCSFNEYITKKNIKKTDYIEQKKNIDVKKNNKQIKKETKINKEIKELLTKYLPKNITIKDEIKKNTKSKKDFTISNYNIPINKKLIKLDRQRKTVMLNKKVLHYFNVLVSQNSFEIGGKLDFNLDNIFERSSTFLGAKDSVVLNIYDYEVPYHTHPLVLLSKNGLIFNTPSVGDYEKETFLGDLGIYLWHTLRTDKYLQQCNIVFSPDGIYVWYYSQELYTTFKKYKDKYSQFKKQFFKLYKKVFTHQLHYNRLLEPFFNNYWIKQLEKIGILMFKYTHDKYNYGLNWNTHWDIQDNKTIDAIEHIKTKTVPKILKGVNVYPNEVPLYIVPIEPLERLN